MQIRSAHFYFLAVFHFFSVLSASHLHADEDLTLPETLDYLKRHINEIPARPNYSPPRVLSTEDNVLSLTRFPEKYNNVETIPLKTIDYTTITTGVGHSGSAWIAFYQYFTEKGFKVVAPLPNSSQTKTFYTQVISDLFFTDKVSADRIALALRHAAILSGATTEPFRDPAIPADQTLSLTDTLAYLKERINRTDAPASFLKLTLTSTDSNVLTLECPNTYPKKGTVTITIPLSAIDYEDISIQNGGVKFHSQENHDAFKVKFSGAPPEQKDYNAHTFATLGSWAFVDPKVAVRIGRALRHAAILAGAKADPFGSDDGDVTIITPPVPKPLIPTEEKHSPATKPTGPSYYAVYMLQDVKGLQQNVASGPIMASRAEADAIALKWISDQSKVLHANGFHPTDTYTYIIKEVGQ